MIAAIPTLLRLAPFIAIAILGGLLYAQTLRLDAAKAEKKVLEISLKAANGETAKANASLLRAVADNAQNHVVIEELQRDRRLADTIAADEVRRLHAELARKQTVREVIREKACTGPVGSGVNAVLDLLQRPAGSDAGPRADDALRDGAAQAPGGAPRLPAPAGGPGRP